MTSVTRGWMAVGSCDQSGSCVRTAAIASLTVSPPNGRFPVSISQHHDAKRPDVGALVDVLPARLLGAHVCGGAENDSGLR